jgi:hypothetical protein
MPTTHLLPTRHSLARRALWHIEPAWNFATTSTARFVWVAATAAVAALALVSTGAQAATQLIDDFSGPAAPTVSVLNTVANTSFSNTLGGVLGGERAVYHNAYANPLNNTSTVSAGGGVLSSVDGIGVTSEVLVSYGAFANPAALMMFNATPFNGFAIDFTSVAIAMNINVVLYTSAPLNPGSPLYYTASGINVAPAVPGGPVSVLLPMSNDPAFNYAQVDGIVLVLNRAIGNVTNNSFVLDNFAFTSSVPEPKHATLMLAGLAVMGWLRVRRSKR